MIGVIAALFPPTACPVGGGGMSGIFGKPLIRAICNAPGLHAAPLICLRFSSGTKTIWPKSAPVSRPKTRPLEAKSFSCGDPHCHTSVR